MTGRATRGGEKGHGEVCCPFPAVLAHLDKPLLGFSGALPRVPHLAPDGRSLLLCGVDALLLGGKQQGLKCYGST